ncbi:hypothetical protein GOP47_0023154 [Adiantum capillus-veneris]|uniref:Uncharacterized protein n=1 Tax=Adiantum capillus-veneris TaxID=13818 RepID=A0A9D4U770_ADICA|nr:hypothetical protein GOP47_0023154 [Adiantum capillus-veneris]
MESLYVAVIAFSEFARNRAAFTKQQSPSFMSAFYDRAVRTNSYNEIVTKINVLAEQSSAQNASEGLQAPVHTDRLLEPTQEAVDSFLREQTGSEPPEMMRMATDFFDNSRMASKLCGTILQSIDKTRGQCERMDATLAEMPRSGEALGFMQQRVLVQGLSEMAAAENSFANSEACEMFVNVRNRYILLSLEVEERRRVVGRKVKMLRRWKGGCIGIAIALVAGATLGAVVVATHVVVSVAAAPAVALAAAVARGQVLQKREGVNDSGREVTGRGLEMDENEPRTQENVVAMTERATLHMDMSDALAKKAETSNDRTEKDATACGLEPRDGNIAVETNRSNGVVIMADLSQRGGCVRRWQGGGRGGDCWCWGMAMLVGQSVKLDALARSNFLVNRMLDTLRCLVTGLQDDVERNKRLVEFGWVHREEAACVQQVGKQLFRSHVHLVRQLANLEEQVVVCFLLINKARGNVLQEFSLKA